MCKKQIIFLLLSIISIPNFFSQCAMCRAALENGDVSTAEGVNNGITYLMFFPYLLIGGLFYAVYRYKKKHKI